MAALALAGALAAASAPAGATQDAPLDPSFSGDGITTLDFGTTHDVGLGVAIQPDGNVVVAGRGGEGIAVARYTTQGVLDATFGGDGRVSVPGEAVDVALDAQGRIVVAGSINNGTDMDLQVTRFDPSGTLDTTFGGDGQVVTDISGSGPGYGDDWANGVAIDADGKILVAGEVDGSVTDFGLVRYTDDGSLDPTFGGGDGVATATIGQGFDQGNDLAIQDDGKIVEVGSAYPPSTAGTAIAVVRFTSDGALDPTFDGDGRVMTLTGTNDVARAVAIGPGDTIVVGGSSFSSAYSDLIVARYLPDGTLDGTFGGGGTQVTSVTGGHDWGSGVATLPDGGVLLVGSGSSGSVFALVEYRSDGTLDTSFDVDGIVTEAVDPYDNAGGDVALQTDGRIVAAGSTGSGTNADFLVARFWTPPQTVIDSGPTGPVPHTATFTFSADDPSSAFECRLDTAPWAACSSPTSLEGLADGGYTFEVRATDAQGETDPTPASAAFVVDDPDPLPDAAVARGSGRWVGKHVYGTDGAGQTIVGKAAPGDALRAELRMGNDGDLTDVLSLSSCGGWHRITVTVHRGTRDITAAVAAGTYQSPSLIPGAVHGPLKILVEIGRAAISGSTRTCRFTVTSGADPAVVDVAAIRITVG